MRLTVHPFVAAAIALSAVTGVAVAGVTAGEPADDPERPTGSVAVRAAPIEEGTGPARVVVTREPGAPARLRWTTGSGTADAGEDYEPAAGLLQFRPGQETKVIEIDVAADGRPEGAETLAVRLDVLPGLPGAAQSAGTTVTIFD